MAVFLEKVHELDRVHSRFGCRCRSDPRFLRSSLGSRPSMTGLSRCHVAASRCTCSLPQPLQLLMAALTAKPKVRCRMDKGLDPPTMRWGTSIQPFDTAARRVG